MAAGLGCVCVCVWGVRAGLSGLPQAFRRPPGALTWAAPAAGSGPAPASLHPAESDKSPRPHPKAEAACGAALGAG